MPDILPSYTWTELFQGKTPYQVQQQLDGQQGTQEPLVIPRILTGKRFIGCVIENSFFKSAETGARIELLPDSDPNIGFVAYDGNNAVIFKILTAGTDVGDITIGDYTHAQGIFYDASTGQLDIQGGIIVNSLDIPDTTTTNSFHVDNTGNIWSGAVLYANGLFKVSNTGALVCTGATITNSTYNVSSLTFQDAFGNGANDVTISVDTTLTADTYYNDLTINAGKILNTAGYRIFVKGTLTINGTISRNGNNGGSGSAGANNGGNVSNQGTAGAALSDGSVKGAVAGAAGGSGQGYGGTGEAVSNGSDVAKSIGSGGIAGTKGGAGGDGAMTGDIGGTAGSKTGTVYNTINNIMAAYFLYDFFPAGDNLKSSSGSGGSGGGGCSFNGCPGICGQGGGGAGSGSPGGIVWIAARIIVISATGVISANGGNGGNGGTGGTDDTGSYGGGGGAGGSGGSGGVIILCYVSLTNSGSIAASGGTAGTGGAGGTGTTHAGYTGANGNTGATGQIIYFQI